MASPVEVEDQILKALSHMLEGETPNIAQATRLINVPGQQLQAQFKARRSKSRQPPTNE